MAGSTPPRSKLSVGDHAWSHEWKVVPARCTWFDERFPESLHYRDGYPNRIVISPGQAGVAVHHDEGVDSLGMGSGQEECSQSAEMDAE